MQARLPRRTTAAPLAPGHAARSRHPGAPLRARLRLGLLALLALAFLAGCGGGDDAPAGEAAAAGAVEYTPTLACDTTNETLGKHQLPATLPADLAWLTNDRDPEFADPKAQRGGTWRTFMTGFPATLRLVGPDSNGGFAGILRPNQLATTTRHPNTLNHIPVLATHWAFGADGRSVFYKLDPKARWSDGKPITADDYLFAIRQLRSEAIVDPWYNDYYTNVIVDVFKYDAHTIGVLGVAARPADEMLDEYGLRPVACHAHKLDKEWTKAWNWLVEPVSGPYQISRIEKGKYVEFRRIADWWGNDHRYLRHRFNPDTVRVTLVRDPEAAFQFFLKGEIDSFGLTLPHFWAKATGEPFDKGWIRRLTYYKEHPESGNGLWFNTADPLLKDRNVRVGIAHSLNFDKVIQAVLRDDYVRSNMHFELFPDYSDASLKALPFDLAAADRAFGAAGFGRRGPDGIRMRGNQRLSIEVAYSNAAHTDRLTVLTQEAKLAGLELKLQQLDPTAFFKKVREKQHQSAWMGWAGASVVPAFWEYYHSVNANVPQTNNVTNYADPETDRLIDAFRAATDKPTRVRLSHQIMQRTHAATVMVPGTRVPFVREGMWRYVKLPPWNANRSTGYGTSSGPTDPFGEGLAWIDQKELAAVEAARKAGTAFPPSNITDTTWKR